MATHCSVLTQEVPWAEELGRLLAMKPPGGRRGSVATQQAGLSMSTTCGPGPAFYPIRRVLPPDSFSPGLCGFESGFV